MRELTLNAICFQRPRERPHSIQNKLPLSARRARSGEESKKEEKLNKRQQRSEEAPTAELVEQPDEAMRADE